ncbi:MAG: serine/threonine-protein kinase [Candidatus Hadarchaeum sp.]
MLCPFCGTVVKEGTIICPTCGVNISSTLGGAATLPLGTKLQNGRYTIGKVLGQGGFGITYLGGDTRLSRPVAIKEFFPEGCQRNGTMVQPTRITPSDFTKMRERFLEEARLLARLNHPGIVKVYDFFEENNTGYMVMEYLKGKSLSKFVKKRGGRLSEQEAVGLILKVCEGLEVVHREGYLHRDIKPENIFVCDDGRVVLIDFGAAREFVATRARKHTVILTSGFAPLEQYSERAKRGAYTDIYALSATLYYLLTGEVPVDAAARMSGVKLKDVRELNSQVSDRVAKAVMSGLEMEVDKRPQSVREFVDILTKGKKKPAQVKRTLTEHTSRVTFVTFSLLVLTGLLLVSGFLLYWFITRPGPPQTLKGHIDWVRSVTFSPDGKILASGSDDKTIKLWRVSDGSLIRTIEGHTDWVRSVTFSPDGQILASGSKDTTIKLWRVSDGSLIRTIEGHTDWVRSVTFSPDGKILASGSDDKTIKLWRVSDGSLIRTLTGHTDKVTSVTFSPDGKILASGSYDKTIKLWRVSDGSPIRTLTGHTRCVNSVTFSPNGQTLASGSIDGTIKLWRVR